MASILKPKVSRPAPLPPLPPEPKSTTTSQLAPKAAKADTPSPKKSTRRFRIDIGDTGFGSGLNIPV